MSIRRRLFILLIALIAMTVTMFITFGLGLYPGTTLHRTYGWSDPIHIHGPERRSTPPNIDATTSTGVIIAVWDDPLNQQHQLMIARSTTNHTWIKTSITSKNTDVNTEPSIQRAGDGSIHLAWRARTSPVKSRETGIYLSGIYWTRTTDLGKTWQEPRPIAIFKGNHTQSYTETMYTKPEICPLPSGIRIYYTSNQDPDQGWIWYRETQDHGRTWTQPTTIPGSKRYHQLLVTNSGDLYTLRQENNGDITLNREGQHEESAVIGSGWPSDLYQDRNNTIWALWDRQAPRRTTKTYILNNGTTRKAQYRPSHVWITSSNDQGETWSQPALLTTQRTERKAVLTQTNQEYTTIYATYPTNPTAPWKETWQWSIKTQHTQTQNINTLKTKETIGWIPTSDR